MMIKHKIRLVVILLMFCLQLQAVTLFVTNTNDAGPGSFRAILASANNGDVIQFNIPGPGPYTIKPLSAYSISRQITIDGTIAGKPGIEFDGSLSTSIAGFDFNSAAGSGTIVQGLVMNNFSYNPNPMVDFNACAISITQASNITVRNCYIGTDVTGTTAKPNKHGIWINGSSNNTIGGPNAADGNLISGNIVRGIWVSAQGGTATNNTVENNKIGMNINGTALPNITGVEYNLTAKDNLIKHNTVSYNWGDGLSFNQGSTGNKIYGNIFSNNGEHGVDFLNGDVGNSVVGVDYNGVGEPNQIFNNGAAGVFVSEWFDGNVYNYGAPSKVTVRKNSIYCNGVKGIALTEKTGPFTSAPGNNGKLSPVINMTSNEEKTFGTAAPGDIIDIYVADNCNACNSNNWQGKTWLASITVGAGGTWSYTKTGGALCNSLIATATDAVGNTSEFVGICTRPSVDIRDTATCSTINLSFDVTHPCAVSYKWSTGATTPTLTLANATPGQYWVELKGSDGVAVKDDFEIRAATPFTVDLGADIYKCENPFSPSVTLTPGLSNSFTYQWSNGLTTSSISVNQHGRYFVKVTDPQSGCVNSDTLDILPNIIPAAVLDDAEFCEGDSVILTPGNFTSYKWNDNSTGASLKVKTSGVYWVKVTNGSGCSDSVSATITVHPKPAAVIAPNDPSICAGTSITLDATTSGVTYNWSTTQTTAAITVSSSGKYVVEVETAYHCKAKDSVTVTVIPRDSASFSTSDYCLNDAATQPAFLSGNTAGGIFSFSTAVSDGATISSSTGKITNGKGGTTYSIKYLTPGSCKDSMVQNVTVMNNPVFTLQPQDVSVCANDPAQFTVAATYALTYQWQSSTDGNTFTDLTEGAPYSGTTTASITVNPVDASMDLLKFRCVAHANTCDAISDVATIFYGKSIALSDPTAAAVCEGSSIQLTSIANGALSYQWQYSTDGTTFQNINNGGAYNDATTSVLTINPVDASMEGYLFRNIATGCINNDTSLTAAISLIPNADITTEPADTAICAGGNTAFSLTAVNALSYQWYVSTNNGATYSALDNMTTNTLNVSPATVAMNNNLYFALVTGTCGVLTSDTVLLNVTDPLAIIDAPATVCPGEPFEINMTANYSNPKFYLDGVLENSNPVTKSILSQITYSLTTEVNGCMSPAVSATVRIIDIPVPEVAADMTVCPETEIQLGITEISGYTYKWTNADGYSSSDVQPKLVPEKTATYIVSVKNTVCTYSMVDSIKVTVRDEMKLFYPNAFTPNEDGVNDVFQVVGEGVVDFNAIIFDRWGEIIYQWNSLDGGWDGRAKDQRQVQIDVYVIKVSASGVCDGQSDVSTVTVIR
ncbi:MAG: gliding motility-associated C-terminal domain-containing protein [Flavobacteriales bacterium]